MDPEILANLICGWLRPRDDIATTEVTGSDDKMYIAVVTQGDSPFLITVEAGE